MDYLKALDTALRARDAVKQNGKFAFGWACVGASVAMVFAACVEWCAK